MSNEDPDSSRPARPVVPGSALDLATMRWEYTAGELRREDLADDPIAQFGAWFQEALTKGVLEPNAMALSTVSTDGRPSIRTVLLKGCDARGFVFYTNHESRKGRDISANARVALLFAWLTLQRQVIVTGVAERVSVQETEAYFATRPRGSQLAAWISRQSSVIDSREVLEIEWQRHEKSFANGPIPAPPHWGGYLVRPEQIEFWQGRASRLHDRFMYSRGSDDKWSIERLSP